MRRCLVLAAVIATVAPPAQAATWRRYVAAPSTRVVAPVRVVSVRGDVENPEALAGGPGAATLRYHQGGRGPRAAAHPKGGAGAGGRARLRPRGRRLPRVRRPPPHARRGRADGVLGD